MIILGRRIKRRTIRCTDHQRTRAVAVNNVRQKTYLCHHLFNAIFHFISRQLWVKRSRGSAMMSIVIRGLRARDLKNHLDLFTRVAALSSASWSDPDQARQLHRRLLQPDQLRRGQSGFTAARLPTTPKVSLRIGEC